MFGLTGNQGNHGEDAKEYWWYTDALPSHAWASWRYHYPQQAFPYDELVAGGRRGKDEPELELLDTGVFDDGHWIVEVDHAKDDPDDVLYRVRVTNAGPDGGRRCTCCRPCGSATPGPGTRRSSGRSCGPVPGRRSRSTTRRRRARAARRPGARRLRARAPVLQQRHEHGARLRRPPTRRTTPRTASTTTSIHGARDGRPRAGAAPRPPPGTACEVQPRETVEVRLRLRPAGRRPAAAERARDAVRRPCSSSGATEADAFYAELAPGRHRRRRGRGHARGLRRACSGASSSTTTTSRAGSTATRASRRRPPAGRHGRNARWRTFESFDILSMPDVWEYPWFAAWDSAFHCVALAHVDPAFAKYQLILLCREWFQHPDGALPAYEWAFDDVNPPVQAWAALRGLPHRRQPRPRVPRARVREAAARTSRGGSTASRSTTATSSRAASSASTTSAPSTAPTCPPGWRLEQADGTGWMAFYTLTMLEIAAELGQGTNMLGARPRRSSSSQHFVAITDAINRQGLWDEEDGFYYDRLVAPDGSRSPVPVRSMVGIVPLLGAVTVHEPQLVDARAVREDASAGMLERRNIDRAILEDRRLRAGRARRSRASCSASSRRPGSCASSSGSSTRRSSSRRTACARSPPTHREHPVTIDARRRLRDASTTSRRSRTPAMFGGNSNWRGPVWFPLNYLASPHLERYGRAPRRRRHRSSTRRARASACR